MRKNQRLAIKLRLQNENWHDICNLYVYQA